MDEAAVSAPVEGQEPNWDTVDPIRTYEYYPNDDPYGQKGLLWRETVPDIDETIDQEREYEYWEMVNQVPKLRQGVTRAKYQYWNGSAYSWATDQTSYDAMGNVISTKDNNNREITYTYDDLGRQLTTTYAPNRYTESQYDCCALTSAKDEDGRYTYYAYDDAKRVTEVWTNLTGQSQANPLVHYDYDSFGNVWKVTTRSYAATPRVTEYLYDKNNRVERINYPAPLGHEEFGYDPVGNLWWKKDGEGHVTLYRYDDLNRLTHVYYNYTGALPPTEYPENADVTYTYHGGSRLRETMVDASGTSSYEYDFQDRLTEYTPPVPADRTVEYGYNNLNQKTETILNVSGSPMHTTSYAYYANGWLKTVGSGGVTATYAYDSVGNRTQVDNANTTYTVYAYDSDPRYRTSAITHYRSGTPPVVLAEITYPDRDGSGNPLRVVDWIGTTQYTYDMNSRLDSTTYPVIGLVDYNYDWVGNRLNPPAPPNPMEFNIADQLTRWPAQHQYEYLGTGSLHEQYDDASPRNLQKTYTYTAANLLAAVQHAGDGTSSMAWDADANRVGFTSSTDGAYSYVYDTTAGIPAVIEESTGGTPTFYIREPGGSLIARAAGASVRYYHFDALGSTRLLTDATGSVTDRYTYDAWGITSHQALQGSVDQPYQYVGELGYYTHYQDANLPVLHLGVRFYDPGTGRFTQRDPASHGWSWYTYVGDNPIRMVDPLGLEELTAEGCKLDFETCMKDSWLYRCRCETGCATDIGFVSGTPGAAITAAGFCLIKKHPYVLGVGLIIDIGTVIAYRMCVKACERGYKILTDTCRMAYNKCMKKVWKREQQGLQSLPLVRS